MTPGKALIISALALATLASGAGRKCEYDPELKQDICTDGDDPQPTPPSPGLTDEEREANRRQRELARQQREHERIDRRNERINELLRQGQAQLEAGRRGKAIALAWKAYKLDKTNSTLRTNLAAVILDRALMQGQEAILGGDTGVIRWLQDDLHDLRNLYERGWLADRRGDLVLQMHELNGILADLIELKEGRRGRSPVLPPVHLSAGADTMHPLLIPIMWANGSKPREYYFGPDSQITKELRKSKPVGRLRYYLYSKYGGRLRNGYRVTNYRVPFGLPGLLWTRTDSEQVVGSFTLEAEVIDGMVRYVAKNNTSLTSFLYGSRLVSDYEDETFRPMSNFRQTYVWWEPIQSWSRRK